MTSFSYDVRVYYQDTDAGGVMYHANYLNFAERARAEALRALGVPVRRLNDEYGMGFVVRRLDLDYQRPARLDEQLVVTTRVLEVGGASAKLRQDFRRDSDSLAVLNIWLVCVRFAEGRAARMPDAWAAAFRRAIDVEGD